MAKIDFAHKAQRKMFEVVLDAAIKHSDSDRRKARCSEIFSQIQTASG